MDATMTLRARLMQDGSGAEARRVRVSHLTEPFRTQYGIQCPPSAI